MAKYLRTLNNWGTHPPVLPCRASSPDHHNEDIPQRTYNIYSHYHNIHGVHWSRTFTRPYSIRTPSASAACTGLEHPPDYIPNKLPQHPRHALVSNIHQTTYQTNSHSVRGMHWSRKHPPSQTCGSHERHPQTARVCQPEQLYKHEPLHTSHLRIIRGCQPKQLAKRKPHTARMAEYIGSQPSPLNIKPQQSRLLSFYHYHHITTPSPHHFITISPYHHITISPYHHIATSPHHFITLLPHPRNH